MSSPLAGRRGLLTWGGFSCWLDQLWHKIGMDLSVLMIYVVITVLVTYPVAFGLSTHLPGNAGDSFEHLWLLWWGKKAMWDLRTSMADLSYLSYPWGIYHPMLSMTPLAQIMAIPFMLLCYPVVAYNLLWLSTFILTAFTTYLLCHHLTGCRWAAFVGGLIYGFAPTRLIHGIGHLAQITTYWFPLLALSLVCFLQRPSYRTGLWAGLLMGLSSLVNFVHTAHFVFIFVLCWLVYVFWTHPRRFLSKAFFRPLALMFAVAALLVVPFLAPFLVNEVVGTTHYYVLGGGIVGSTNPYSFLAPSLHHPVVRALGLTDTLAPLLGPNPVDGWAYLGLLPVILAVWGWAKYQKRASFWAAYAALSAVLSMGPFLRLGSRLLVIDQVDGIDAYLPLPYMLLRLIPLFKMSRTPARIAVGTPMALAVLVSLGMLEVGRCLKGRRRVVRWILISVFSIGILFEYCFAWPYPVTAASVPSFYAQMREEAGEFAIVDYPLNVSSSGAGISFNRPMFYQTVHEHPIAGGRTWRHTQEGIATAKIVQHLVSPDEAEIAGIWMVERSDDERIAWLSTLGFRYLVQHKMVVDQVSQEFRDVSAIALEREHFESWFSEPVYEDKAIVAYRVPHNLDVPSDALPLSQIVFGWYEPEGESTEDRHRWFAQEGRVHAHVLEPTAYRLSWDARAFDHPRDISLWVNDDSVYTAKIGLQSRQFVSPVFELQPGLNELRFKANESCDTPADLFEDSNDYRCLSADFYRFSWMDPKLMSDPRVLRVQFGDKFVLLDYESDQEKVSQGDLVRLRLRWDVLQSPERDYTLFAHIWSQENGFAGQWDSEPLAGAYHTSWLDSGEIIEDWVDIPIWPDAEVGNYMLLIGWYDRETGERLLLHGDPNATALELAPIVVLEE